MLANRLPISKLIFLLLLLSLSITLFAQPTNDRCDSPTLLELGLDAESCIPVRGDTRGTEDATLVEEAPEVCSGSWFTDDVWYSFDTGDEVPPFGVTVEVRLDSTSGTELIEHGMAIYQDCDMETSPIDCFSDIPGRRTIEFPITCMAPNSSYLIRLWSAPEPRTYEGTFSICAYASPEDTTVFNEPMPRVIYEETFDEGFNGWESVSQSQSYDGVYGPIELVDDHWMWTESRCLPSAFGGLHCIALDNLCTLNGAIGVPAGFYQYGREPAGPSVDIFPPFPKVNTYVVSPSIDLFNESCVNLTWIESARLREGDSLSILGTYVQYSLDDGKTWKNPSNSIGTSDVSTNYGGNYIINGQQTNGLERSIPLIGAEGNGNVKIRFGFDGDFYFWIIDNVRIVESATIDAVAQENSFARATINPMSIYTIDTYDFLIDIANLSCGELTNVNANMTITNSQGIEVHNVNIPYGTIQSDSFVQNKSFLQPFKPLPYVDELTHTYSISADRDDDHSNDTISFQTNIVDETIFRKENGNATTALSPDTSPGVFWEEGDFFDWEVGNIFFAPFTTTVQGGHLEFSDVSFQLDNPEEIIGELMRIWLYEISDNNFDNIIPKDDDSEIKRIGISEHVVTGLENGLIKVGLVSFTGDRMIMEPNKHYMVTIQSVVGTTREHAMAIAADDTYDYSAALANTRLSANGDLKKVRYGNAFSITKENYFRIGPGNSSDNTTGNFPENITPIIRLEYEIRGNPPPPNSTVEINNEIIIDITPNPTVSELILNLSIAEATDLEISIVDLTGRNLNSRSIKGVTELTESFDVSALANGVYMIHVNTKEGVQTKKFVINR